MSGSRSLAGGSDLPDFGGDMTNGVGRRPSVFAAVAALIGVSVFVVAAGPRLAGAAVSWSAVNPAMPPDAVAGLGASFESASCPAEGWCIAVGSYQAFNGTTNPGAGVIDSESGSTWSATEAPLPSDASTTDPQADLDAVSCPAVGSCVAVGRYLDGSGATQVLVEQLSNGTWTPSGVTLPPDALTSGPNAYAQSERLVVPVQRDVHGGGPLHPVVRVRAGPRGERQQRHVDDLRRPAPRRR